MHIQSEGLVERLDEMVEAGHLTQEEAERLRAAADSGELDEVVREMRLEHAGARAENGRLTQEEAVLDRVENGGLPQL